MARFGRIDVLVNNAGYAVVGAVEETSDDELRAIMQTNFFGAMAVTRAALPIFRAQRAGAIVNISSLGGQLSYAGFSAYSASKFALEGASEALALEMAPFGVKVLIVEPGAFRTELVGAAMREMPVIAGYEDTVGATRAFSRAMHRTQEGDPRKAAIAIEQALDAEKTPLRLQLGADAITAVRAHAQALLADMAAWEAVSLATRIDDAGN
jgi:NAD(P)-dependent dehydrogenase (short-subunit alcohol dehydrogenase family)